MLCPSFKFPQQVLFFSPWFSDVHLNSLATLLLLLIKSKKNWDLISKVFSFQIGEYLSLVYLYTLLILKIH